MQVEMVVKGTHIGNYARERIEHRIGKAVERYRREIPVRISLQEKKGMFEVRVACAVDGRELLARSKLEALDEAAFKFERQLKKMTDRRSRHRENHRRPGHRQMRPVSSHVIQDVEDDVSTRIQQEVFANAV
jgi:ribosome-associated translation inhibitor RaiA